MEELYMFVIRYVDFCVDRVKLLQFYDIKPIFVFDGGPLPSKGGTEVERHQYLPHNILLLLYSHSSMSTIVLGGVRTTSVKAINTMPKATPRWLPSASLGVSVSSPRWPIK